MEEKETESAQDLHRTPVVCILFMSAIYSLAD